MSFTTKIKNELASLSLTETERLALLSGFIRNNVEIKEDALLLMSENNSVVTFLKEMLEEILDTTLFIEYRDNLNFSKNALQVLRIEKKKDLLLEEVGYQKNNVYLETPPTYLVDGNAEIRSYLRGVFLAKGSVNDPKTSRYHMEILTEKAEEAVFVQKLINLFDLNAKLLNRDKGYMVYIKEADRISDLLKLLGANNAVLYFEDIRIYRNQKNHTNRLNNCEQANTDKVIETALEQLRHIEIIRKKMGVDLLDDKTKEALIYREKYKEASLKELAEIISIETRKPITKSGLNHRFRKIKDLALKLEEE